MFMFVGSLNKHAGWKSVHAGQKSYATQADTWSPANADCDWMDHRSPIFAAYPEQTASERVAAFRRTSVVLDSQLLTEGEHAQHL